MLYDSIYSSPALFAVSHSTALVTLINCGPKYLMENPRNKLLISFKLNAFLSSVMKSCAAPFYPTWDASHPFVQCLHTLGHYPPISHFVTILVFRPAVMLWQCLCLGNSYLTL